MEKDALLRKVSDSRGQLIRLCSDLVKIPSENPPGETLEVANFIGDYLSARGFKVHRFEPRKGLPNLVVQQGYGKGTNLVISGHMDVFPAIGKWRSPPFSGQAKCNKILGRGTIDMKGGLAASIHAFLAISETNLSIPGRLTLCVTSDEETMGKWGAKWLLDNVSMVRGDACLIGEPTGLDVLTFGEKGIWWFTLETFGKEAHGAYSGGKNAIRSMMNALEKAEELKKIKGKIPNELREIISYQKSIIEKMYWRNTSQALDHVTINVGVIQGGEKVNLVPRSCKVEVDCRLPLGIDVDIVRDTFKKMLSDAHLSNTKLATVFEIDPNYTCTDEEFVRISERNVESIAKERPKLFFRLGSTDGKFFRKKGIPTVSYGPHPRSMGKPNEYISLSELTTVARVHAGIVYDMAVHACSG